MRRPPTREQIPTSTGSLCTWRWTGDPARAWIVALHGFGGSGLDFEALAAVDATANLLAVDLLGHGESARAELDAAYAVERQVRGVSDVLEAMALPQPHLLGYSMGARLALNVALALPRALAGLTIISGTAGLDDPGERAARRRWDHEMAAVADTHDAAAFDRRWAQLPLIASCRANTPEPWGTRLLARRATSDTRALARSLRAMGTGTMPSVWERLSEIDLPVQIVIGAQDHKYVELGQRLWRALPTSDLHVVSGSGHAPHVEQAAAVAAIVAPPRSPTASSQGRPSS